MNDIEKRFFKKSAIYFLIAEILCFLAFYIAAFTLPHEVTAYAYYYLVEVVDFALPVFAAFTVYIAYSKLGVGGALIRAIVPSVTTLAYVFPYHAFAYAYEQMVITDVLLYSSIQAAFALVVAYVKIVALAFVMIFASRMRTKKHTLGKISSNPAFDLSIPLNFAIFASTAAMFVYKLAIEIYDTVVYITEYIETYVTSEIVYMVFRYIFLLILLLGVHFAVCKIKNKLANSTEA